MNSFSHTISTKIYSLLLMFCVLVSTDRVLLVCQIFCIQFSEQTTYNIARCIFAGLKCRIRASIFNSFFLFSSALKLRNVEILSLKIHFQGFTMKWWLHSIIANSSVNCTQSNYIKYIILMNTQPISGITGNCVLFNCVKVEHFPGYHGERDHPTEKCIFGCDAW